MCCVLKMLKFIFVKMSDMPCVLVCVPFGVEMETDADVNIYMYIYNVVRDMSVGIAIHYGMDGPVIESR
jgi:hypothetical protein